MGGPLMNKTGDGMAGVPAVGKPAAVAKGERAAIKSIPWHAVSLFACVCAGAGAGELSVVSCQRQAYTAESASLLPLLAARCLLLRLVYQVVGRRAPSDCLFRTTQQPTGSRW